MANISIFFNRSTFNNGTVSDSEFQVLYFVIFSFSVFLGIFDIILNAVALSGINMTRGEGNVTLTLLRYNAVMDIFSGLFIIYGCIINIIMFENSFECGFRHGGMVGVFCAAGILILGVNMERYVKIIFPLNYEYYMTPKVVAILITFVWLVVFGFLLSGILKQAITFRDDQIQECDFFAIFEGTMLLVLCVEMFTVFGLQLLMYLHILCIAMSKIKTDLKNKRASNGQRLKIFESWWKPYKVLFLIVGLNFLSISPCGKYSIFISFLSTVFQP